MTKIVLIFFAILCVIIANAYYIYISDLNDGYLIVPFIFLLLNFLFSKVGLKSSLVLLLFTSVSTIIAANYYYNTNYTTVFKFERDFKGTVFILFDREEGKELPLLRNMLHINVDSKSDFVGITSTSFEKFINTRVLIKYGEKPSSYLENILRQEKKRIFNYKFDSLQGTHNKFYFLSFLVTQSELDSVELMLHNYLEIHSEKIDTYKSELKSK
ncbi:MAG: hypothetical protein WD048_12005 [Chitinophagales bacterium]